MSLREVRQVVGSVRAMQKKQKTHSSHCCHRLGPSLLGPVVIMASGWCLGDREEGVWDSGSLSQYALTETSASL